MIEFKHLDWDSDFWSLKIGKLSILEFDETEIQNILAQKKAEKYQLIYIFSKNNDLNHSFLLKNNGKLIDQKLTFRFEKKENTQSESKHPSILFYQSQKLVKSLLELAIQSGHFSRFYLDDNFEKGGFEKLYKLWIENSINKKIADDVIVWQENKQILGMVTVKYTEKAATIGLIAVDNASRGQRIGTHLLNELKHIIQSKSIRFIDVSTQKNNERACDFYEKNEFSIHQTDFIYHIWI